MRNNERGLGDSRRPRLAAGALGLQGVPRIVRRSRPPVADAASTGGGHAARPGSGGPGWRTHPGSSHRKASRPPARSRPTGGWRSGRGSRPGAEDWTGPSSVKPPRVEGAGASLGLVSAGPGGGLARFEYTLEAAGPPSLDRRDSLILR